MKNGKIEVRNVKSKLDMESFIDFVAGKGFRSRKRGFFSRVLFKPNGRYVWKIAKDPSFLAFAKMVIKKNNPHFPKFLEIQNRVYVDAHKIVVFQVYKMERLREFPRVRTLFGYDVGYSEAHYAEKMLMNNPAPEALTWYYTQPKSMRSAIRSLKNLVDRNEHLCLDLHEKNFMLRDDCVVITDPFSS